MKTWCKKQVCWSNNSFVVGTLWLADRTKCSWGWSLTRRKRWDLKLFYKDVLLLQVIFAILLSYFIMLFCFHMWQVVDGAGHFLQESHGEELANNILDFLKSQSWRSSLFDARWNVWNTTAMITNTDKDPTLPIPHVCKFTKSGWYSGSGFAGLCCCGGVHSKEWKNVSIIPFLQNLFTPDLPCVVFLVGPLLLMKKVARGWREIILIGPVNLKNLLKKASGELIGRFHPIAYLWAKSCLRDFALLQELGSSQRSLL